MSKNKKQPPTPKKQTQLPSTGEGADSALDVLRRKRQEQPGDNVPPLPPARK